MTDHRKFLTDITVRFRDLDAMGHVNNAVYITYFEEGRKAFFLQLSDKPEGQQFNFILAHVSCDYLRPVTLRDKVAVQMWISYIGNKRFDFRYRLISRDDESIVYARGESVQVGYDYQTNNSMTLSDEFLKNAAVYVELDEPRKTG
ncbi:MAG: acyl-CoA thioesterase [Deltaproteobacteria bacterium]|nr:acyl-CoA thioesterase [Deltaproteobacteria bacterium]MBF0524926.1 acyl-CoA thioesterase [Deltaproteobacteria bacterium]